VYAAAGELRKVDVFGHTIEPRKVLAALRMVTNNAAESLFPAASVLYIGESSRALLSCGQQELARRFLEHEASAVYLPRRQRQVVPQLLAYARARCGDLAGAFACVSDLDSVGDVWLQSVKSLLRTEACILAGDVDQAKTLMRDGITRVEAFLSSCAPPESLHYLCYRSALVLAEMNSWDLAWQYARRSYDYANQMDDAAAQMGSLVMLAEAASVSRPTDERFERYLNALQELEYRLIGRLDRALCCAALGNALRTRDASRSERYRTKARVFAEGVDSRSAALLANCLSAHQHSFADCSLEDSRSILSACRNVVIERQFQELVRYDPLKTTNVTDMIAARSTGAAAQNAKPERGKTVTE
jgi:hypothetical protein